MSTDTKVSEEKICREYYHISTSSFNLKCIRLYKMVHYTVSQTHGFNLSWNAVSVKPA